MLNYDTMLTAMQQGPIVMIAMKATTPTGKTGISQEIQEKGLKMTIENEGG